MLRKLLLRILLLISLCASAASPLHAQKLLLQNEQLEFTFRTINNKKVLIATDREGKYLVYRYGTDITLELQFPDTPDTTSWQKFGYYGISRPQGPDGTGALNRNFLVFTSGHYRYKIYDMVNENKYCYVGLTVLDTVTKIETHIHGIYNTKRGDLFRFRNIIPDAPGNENYED